MWISEVKYQDPRTGAFLGSPSLVRLPDGALLASHDYFGRGCPLNMEGEESLTSIYRSEDDGLTWWNVTHVSGAFWNTLFVHAGSVWLMGPAAQWGHIVIRRSDDGGFTWTHPADKNTGLLVPAGPGATPPNFHTAPVPALLHKGRLYRAMEDKAARRFDRDFLALVLSADEDADLLRRGSWTVSNKLEYDLDADPPDWGTSDKPSNWLEGNVVAGPDGRLWNILRLSVGPVHNKVAHVEILDDGKRLAFDPETGFHDFPGGGTKFTIRHDPVSGLYWSLVNDMMSEPYKSRRNRLSVTTSADLVTWTRRKILLDDNLEADPANSHQLTGFQYVDWHFDGNDIIYLTRTAYSGAHNFHDANRITFSRIRDFRLLADRTA